MYTLVFRDNFSQDESEPDERSSYFLGAEMRTLAAVALEAGKPLQVMEVELDGPRAGEVLVEIKATGLCHTDEFTRSGDDPEGIFRLGLFCSS